MKSISNVKAFVIDGNVFLSGKAVAGEDVPDLLNREAMETLGTTIAVDEILEHVQDHITVDIRKDEKGNWISSQAYLNLEELLQDAYKQSVRDGNNKGGNSESF